MKFQHSLLVAALLSLGASAVHANTVDLNVTGTLTVPSCTITLSAGTVDFGQIDLATLSDVADNPLPNENVDVAIACSSAAKLATQATDNRSGTASTAGNDNFGFNNTTDGKNIGFYRVFAENGLADSVATTVIGSSNGTSWTSPVGGVPVQHTGSRLTSVGATATGPVAATTMGWTLRIEPTIASANALALTGPESIDGQMTLTLYYM